MSSTVTRLRPFSAKTRRADSSSRARVFSRRRVADVGPGAASDAGDVTEMTAPPDSFPYSIR